MNLFKGAFLLLILTQVVYSQSALKINEVLSSNNSFLPDDEGSYYDWIELYNSSDSIIALKDYYLSDDTSDITKWQFPDIKIIPDSFLIVFASDKGSGSLTNHWETIINQGDEWKYFVGTSEPPASWRTISYNDILWLKGSSGFGFGDNDDATIISNSISVYLRKKFIINNPEKINEILFHIDFDDGFVAYINGVEIARSNIGTKGIPPAYNQTATNAGEAVIYSGGVPDKFVVENWQSIILEGENVLTVQVHNNSGTSSDLTAIPFLTLGLFETPENPVGPAEVLKLQSPKLHTNFKINADGEYLILSDPQQNLTDKIFSGALPSDISRGRFPDGDEQFFYFNEPTPGEKNSNNHFTGIEEPPQFSLPSGFYTSNINLEITSNNPSAKIYYTSDGSEPDTSSLKFNSPFTIDKTIVIRAKIISENLIPGRTVTKTYLLNENSTLPVISITTDPANLWDQLTGIYVLGNNAEPSVPNYGANFWQDWEKPMHIEFFEPSGDTGFSLDAGVKIFGGWSRAHPQKSLSIFARSVYGEGEINYKIFPELNLEKFESIILRNSGNDWNYSYIRDALMTGIASETGLDVQAYRPATIFLNGEYWGIQNIREKINEHFIASYYDVEADSVIILENRNSVVEGDNEKYNLLLKFLETNSLSSQANYDYAASQIDIENFRDYSLLQIYYDNRDWPGNNIKFWNSYTPGFKWRWLMYDTDFGFGLYDLYKYDDNTLIFALSSNGPDWPNPPWSTLLLRKLMENEKFRIDFINRYNDLSNTILKPEYISAKINSMVNVMESEIERHLERWDGSYSNWLNEINSLHTFGLMRPQYVNSHFQSQFNLEELTSFELNGDSSKGFVKVNSLKIKSFPWTGSYFGNNPVTITALPFPGFKFSHWEGYSSSEKTITFLPKNLTNIIPVFEADTSGSVVINEINYNSSETINSEDWTELYNSSGSPIDISGWIFKDEDDDHSFVIPAGTILNADEYIVLVRDSSLFTSVYPDCKNFFGNVSFGLSSNSELVRLYDNNLYLIDSLTYDDKNPWPEDPDGKGKSLSLINPDLDNSLPENWGASLSSGTPGKINDITSDVEDNLFAPKEFYLSQNYPNPFNPSTIISYALPKAGNVSLKIYDILGREIKTLINEFQEAAFYSINFNADGLASGVYFYRLKIDNNFNQIKKMILLH